MPPKMTNDEILKELREYEWNSNSIEEPDEMGTTAFMFALQIENTQLINELIKHPSTDIHAIDNLGCNAYWYATDFKSAYPLLQEKGVDINRLNDKGQHFLIHAVWMDSMALEPYEEPVVSWHRIELAVNLGVDVDQIVQSIPLKEHFRNSCRDVLDKTIILKEKKLLSHLPKSNHPPKKIQKI